MKTASSPNTAAKPIITMVLLRTAALSRRRLDRFSRPPLLAGVEFFLKQFEALLLC